MPTVQTNGIETYYEEYGAGPPVVFLHGAAGDHRLWAEQARPLADDYRIIVYDFRGHGRTGSSEVESYTMDLYAEDLHDFIESLGLDRPAICGLSMGGMVAQTYAARYPETIAAMATLGTMTPETLAFSERFNDWFYRTFDILGTIVGRERAEALVHRINQWRYHENSLGDVETAERIQQSHAGEFPEMTESEEEKMREALDAYSSMSIDHASIGVPSLLMYGEYEPKTAARHARFMAAEIPRAETTEIPGAGHNSHADNPEFIVESLREFLAEAFEGRHSTS